MSDTLEFKEPHPLAQSALHYVIQNMTPILKESMASCAIENNRMAEICLGTWKRLENAEPVSDRYLLGLAWFIRNLNEIKKQDLQSQLDGVVEAQEIRARSIRKLQSQLTDADKRIELLYKIKESFMFNYRGRTRPSENTRKLLAEYEALQALEKG